MDKIITPFKCYLVQPLNIYKRKKGIRNIKVRCLNYGIDQHHLWNIYGKKKQGVCLWFDREVLLQNIRKNKSLTAKRVNYFTVKELSYEANIDMLPFIKRSQYEDEKEFRIIYEYDVDNCSSILDGVNFPSNSLQKIFFNSWLDDKEYKKHKEYFKEIAYSESFTPETLKIKRNRITDFKDWKSAANGINISS